MDEGFDWVCAKDETVHISRQGGKSKGPLATLLASLDYYPEETKEKPVIPDRSTFVVANIESCTENERRGLEEGENLHKEELALEEELPDDGNNLLQSPQYIPHVDEKAKAQSRAKELEEVRQMNLASQYGKLQTSVRNLVVHDA